MAVGTIVVLILGILIVGGGLLLVKKITAESEGVVRDVSVEQRGQLRELLRSGKLMAVYPSSQRITQKDPGIFALAVENRLSAQKTFEIQVEIKDSADANADNQFRRAFIDRLAVERNSVKDAAIIIEPKSATPKGIYTVFVTVKDGADTYGSGFFTVNVQ